MSTIVEKASVPCGRAMKYMGVEIIVVSRTDLKEWLEENFPYPGPNSRSGYDLHCLSGDRSVITCRLSYEYDQSNWGFKIDELATRAHEYKAIKVEFKSSADKLYVVLGT